MTHDAGFDGFIGVSGAGRVGSYRATASTSRSSKSIVIWSRRGEREIPVQPGARLRWTRDWHELLDCGVLVIAIPGSALTSMDELVGQSSSYPGLVVSTVASLPSSAVQKSFTKACVVR